VQPTTASWKALMLALKEDSKLEVLPLPCQSPDPCGMALACRLVGTGLIQRLLMWGTNCGDGGITALLELLRKNALTVSARPCPRRQHKCQ
jgi:hypothetical protein